MKQIVIDENSAGKRVDVLVAEIIENLSRASARKLCDMGLVKVNDRLAEPSDKPKVGDKLKFDYKPEKQFKIPKINLPIIYEDDDCVVINKPVGVLTHSKGSFNPEATVATWLAERTLSIGTQKGKEQPEARIHFASGAMRKTVGLSPLQERNGIVHRLDRATSGIMVCAKTPEALSWLQKQFSQRKVKKTYIAIVEGELKSKEAIIDMPIERNPKAPATFRVGANGKQAVTKYKVLKESENYSLLELKPETGRTHQLRVHLAQLGHPIVGDTIYNGKAAERLFLHALELEITLPNRERKAFKAALPAIFNKFLRES